MIKTRTGDTPTMTVPDAVRERWQAAVDRTGAPAATALVSVMVAVTALQHAVLPAVGVSESVIDRALYFHTAHPEWLWTVATSAVAHGGFLHLAINAQLVLGFGSLVEPDHGSRSLLVGFAAGVAGALAAALALHAAIGGSEAYVGASGGAFGLLGWLAGRTPSRRLPTIPPGPAWMLAALVGAASVGLVVVYGVGAFGIAHVPHVGGLLAGAAAGVASQ
jgi:membrane associated rhomboid family serine protease